MNTGRLATAIRIRALEMVHRSGGSHIGSALSMADLLAVLYGEALRYNPADPAWAGRDRLLLSKGHATSILYAVLAECGFFPLAELKTYCEAGSRLLAHASHRVPGVEMSTGSLGHALAVGCGMAMAAKADGQKHRVFVILSDGELDEGSNWEAILFAAQHKLDGLCAIIDFNKIQSFGTVKDVMGLEPLADKWRAFGWSVAEVDGHNLGAIGGALKALPIATQKPTAIIAHTVKGKGVSFMEGRLEWHYKSPNDEQLAQALQELGQLS